MKGTWIRFAVRHYWLVIILWLVLIGATLPLAVTVTKHLTTNGFEGQHTQVRWATNTLNTIHPPPAPQPFLIEHLSRARSEDVGQTLEIPRSAFHRVDHQDTLFLPPKTLTMSQSHQLESRLKAQGAQISSTGQLSIGKMVTHDASHTLTSSGVVAMPVLAVLLLMVFGSVAAISLPLIIALAGSEISLAAVSLISRHMQLSVFLTDIVSFLALGVGVDYALFISTRFRQNLDEGQPVMEAIVDAMGHAGRSVLYSGIAVALAVATLMFGSDAYWRGLAVGGAVAIFAVLLATHTLLPAIMAAFNQRIHWGRIPRPDFHLWSALSRAVTRRPIWAILIALVILVPFARLAPQIRMSTPANLATMLPPSNPLRLAVQKQQAIQGAGTIAPIAVVVRYPTAIGDLNSWQRVDRLTRHLESLPDVAKVASPTNLHVPLPELAIASQHPALAPTALKQGLKNFLTSQDPRLVVVYVTAKTGPNEPGTSTLVGRIDRHLPQWVPPGTRAAAGGLVPVLRSFNLLTQSRIPWIVASALMVALVVLTVATRSLVQALLGVIFDGLVGLATAGFMVFVNHHQLLGLERQPLDSSITPLIFVLLFGLSMDYEVILLHRMQERISSGSDPRDAVRQGLATTGAMITGAGMIMVVVFLALLISPLQIMKTLGIGLSFAVLADTWVVRSLLVPSTTALLNRWGFWPWKPKASARTSLQES